MNELFAPPESGLLISYLRVSLEDENTGESESISNQRDLIGCYLKQHPEFTAYKVMEVVDDGHSGTNFDRPGIKRVLELVRQRKVAAILVKDLSRFGRNYKEVGSYLEQVFPFLGVRFISVNDGYDSNEYIGSTGGLDIACKALVHDLYSRDISRKVKSSRYARLRRGDYFCSVAPYGYVKSSEDKHRLVIDPPAAKVVRRIFDMTLAGFCTTEIARTLIPAEEVLEERVVRVPGDGEIRQVRVSPALISAQTAVPAEGNPVNLEVLREAPEIRLLYRDGTAWELEREHVFQKEGRPDYCANAGEDGLLILNWFLREAPPDLEDLEAVEVNGIRCPVE